MGAKAGSWCFGLLIFFFKGALLATFLGLFPVFFLHKTKIGFEKIVGQKVHSGGFEPGTLDQNTSIIPTVHISASKPC
jgi:hypothetical protein